LRSLSGFSCWSDKQRIQELLRARQSFLIEATTDPGAQRFSCGQLFLQRARHKESWPAAEPLTTRWKDAVLRALGPRGAADWTERALHLQHKDHKQIASRQKLADFGRLYVRKIKAQNLHSTSTWDAINAFVVVELAGQRKQTGITLGNQPSVEWRKSDDSRSWEELWFDIESLRKSAQMKIQLWDYDGFTADQALGHVNEDGSGGLNLVDILTPSAPLPPQMPSLPHPEEPSDGLGRALQHFGFGKSSEQEAQEALDWEMIQQQHRAAYQAALRDHSARHPIELHSDGSITCRLRPLPLVGEGSGNGGACIEFELFYESGDTGNPLVLQPEADDDALALLGQVETRLKVYHESFFQCSEGFFLPVSDGSIDMPADGLAKSSIGGAASYPHAPPRVAEEVFRYNRLLDRISVITTNGPHPSADDQVFQRGQHSSATDSHDPNMSRDSVQGGVTSRDHLLEAKFNNLQSFGEELRSLLQQIREVERTVSHGTRQFFAFQDELLPSIGEWSTDRRRRLRNQVFLAELEIERRQQEQIAADHRTAATSVPRSLSALLAAAPSVSDLPVQPVALALCVGLSIYAVAMITLIFGGGWACQGWIMLLASILAVACLALAGYLHVKKLFSGTAGATDSGKGYAKLMAESSARAGDTSSRSAGSDERGDR